MTVEEELRGKRVVIVGVQIDGHGCELLNWAIVKVAEPGDHVVAVHVCKNSDVAKKNEPLLDVLVRAYDELCNIKQVSLSSRISMGRSIKKCIVTEAKAFRASVVIVGVTVPGALGQGTSAARYCAKHLPLPIEVMAINNGKVVYRSISSKNVSDLNGEPQPSLRPSRNSDFSLSGTYSECRHSNSLPTLCKGDLRETRSFSSRLKRVSLRSSAHCTTDALEQIPGWPLLRTNSVTSLPKATSIRKMSVVQWVMSLPDRSPPLTPQSSKDSGSPHRLESVDSSSIYGDRSERCKFSSGMSDLYKEFGRLLDSNSFHIKLFSYDSMSKATSQFSTANLIGKGGCNHVYKGVLPDGKLVAVKVTISSNEAQNDHFLKEIEIVSTLIHKNIVPLLGVCIEDNNLISVYDLLPKGSLEENLLDAKALCQLTWEVRFKIAVGVAEALSYLHSRCSRPVVHRDVKSSNILLLDTLEPQLSDFGLAIWGPEKSAYFTRVDVVGTFGYLAPEYFMYGKVSEKVDVYSFGVVLLELLSGRRPICSESQAQESLVMWARPLLNKGDMNGLLDPNLRGRSDEAQVKQIVAATKLCLTRSARLRPNMTEILRLIKGEQVPEQSKWLNLEPQPKEGLPNLEDNWDDEVYPESCAESHLNLAFLDVTEDSNSFSSTDRCNRLSVEEYLKGRWSRSSSLEN